MRRAEEFYRKAGEPMGLRSAWTLHAQALLATGQLAGAERLAQQIQTLAEELSDDRGNGWARYLLGYVALRRGELDEAAALFQEGHAFAVRGTDVVGQTISESRLAFVQGAQGKLDEALRSATSAAQMLVQHRLRHQYNAADGVFLAVAALWRLRNGAVSADVESTVQLVRKKREKVVQILGYVLPFYLAGRAAWLHVNGDEAAGRAGFEEAIALAEERGLYGELHDIYMLAAQIHPEPRAAEAAEQVARLRTVFREG
jgi:ATP/maltotriose-dependent transcriptional regulator MalT